MSSGMSKLFGTVGKSSGAFSGLGESSGKPKAGPDKDELIEKYIESHTSQGPGECLTWTGYSHRGIAPTASMYGTRVNPRRWVWEWNVGLLESGDYLHVSCGNKLCMNPDHMFVSRKAYVGEKKTFGKTRVKPDVKFANLTELKKNGCLVWTGPAHRGIYPYFYTGKEHASVKRWVWEKHHARPRTEERVHSSCGNKLCVNIEHLYVKVGPRRDGIKAADRFDEIVQEKYDKYTVHNESTGCSIWKGPSNRTTPRTSAGNVQVQVRRWVYERAYGKLPEGRVYILSSCRDPHCVSRAHVVLSNKSYAMLGA